MSVLLVVKERKSFKERNLEIETSELKIKLDLLISKLANHNFEMIPFRTVMTENGVQTGLAQWKLEDFLKSLIDLETTAELKTQPERIEALEKILISSEIGLSVQRKVSFCDKQVAVSGMLRYFCNKTRKSADFILAEQKEMDDIKEEMEKMKVKAKGMEGEERELIEAEIKKMDDKIKKEWRDEMKVMREMSERLEVDLGEVYVQIRELQK